MTDEWLYSPTTEPTLLSRVATIEALAAHLPSDSRVRVLMRATTTRAALTESTVASLEALYATEAATYIAGIATPKPTPKPKPATPTGTSAIVPTVATPDPVVVGATGSTSLVVAGLVVAGLVVAWSILR